MAAAILGKIGTMATKLGQRAGAMHKNYNEDTNTMFSGGHFEGLSRGGVVATGFLGLKAQQADDERKKRKDSLR